MKNTSFLTLVVTILSIFSSAAFAVELPEGPYRFTGEVEAISHKITELVYSQTAAGKERVAQLKSEGYTCQNVIQMQVTCSNFSKDLIVPDHLMERLNQKYLDYTIQFDQVESAEQTNDSEYLTEYKVSQKVSLRDLITNSYALSILKGGLHKIKMILSDDQNYYFNYTTPSELQIVQAFKETKGQITHLYLVEVSLVR